MPKIKDLALLGERGFFAWALENSQLSFITSEDEAKTLDDLYFYGHSGNKEQSIYLESCIDNLGEEEGLIHAFKAIILRNKDKWERLYSAFVKTQYKPIENYSMTETENVGSKVTTTTNQNSSVYGFNSESSSPTAESGANVVTAGNKEDNERILTRSGNIGVTTSQQMIQSEIDLRKWSYYDNLLVDLDNTLSACYYQ